MVNENNGNNIDDQPRNDDNIPQTLAGIAQTPDYMVKWIDKKNTQKMPRCDVKFYGKQKDGALCALAKVAWNVNLWCQTNTRSSQESNLSRSYRD